MGPQTAFFSAFLYPGENMLIIADDKVVVDTVIFTSKRLKHFERPLDLRGVKKIRVLSLFKRTVYLDTTVSNEHHIERFGFSRPYTKQEITEKKAELGVPSIGESTRRLTVIDSLNSKTHPMY